MRDVDSSTELVDGALILEEGVYDSLQGTEFSNDYIKCTGNLLTEAQAKNDPLWFALARNNQELLDAYVSATFKKMKDKYKRNTAMGVYLSDISKKTFLRAWCLGRFGNNYSNDRSSALGYCSLGDGNARVVGVAPEAPLNKK